MIPWLWIVVLLVLGWTLYYQVMCWRYKLSIPVLVMKLEDKIMNETIYQLTKRGYSIKFYYKRKDNDYTIAVKHTNVPKWKKPFLKLLILFQVLKAPAWWYREIDGDIEDECMPSDEDDFDENFQAVNDQRFVEGTQ